MEMEPWPGPAQSVVKPLCAPVQGRWRGGQHEITGYRQPLPGLGVGEIKKRLEVFAVLLLQQFSLLTQWQGWGTERLGGALDLQATVSPCLRVALTTSYNLPGPSRTFCDLSEPSRTFSSRADIEQSRGRSAGAERMWRTPCSPCGPVPHISWLPHGLDLPGAGGRQGRQGRGEEAPQLPARTCRRSQLQLVAPGRSQIGAPFKPQLCAFCFQREVHLLCACKMDKTRGTFFLFPPRPPLLSVRQEFV